MANQLLSIISFNICHSRNIYGVIDVIRTHRPDIIFIQEIPILTDELNSKIRKIDYVGYTSLLDDNNQEWVYYMNLP